jgi:hypothetical protein
VRKSSKPREKHSRHLVSHPSSDHGPDISRPVFCAAHVFSRC